MSLAHGKGSINIRYHYSYNEFDIYVDTFLPKYPENGSLDAVWLSHLVSNSGFYQVVSNQHQKGIQPRLMQKNIKAMRTFLLIIILSDSKVDCLPMRGRSCWGVGECLLHASEFPLLNMEAENHFTNESFLLPLDSLTEIPLLFPSIFCDCFAAHASTVVGMSILFILLMETMQERSPDGWKFQMGGYRPQICCGDMCDCFRL